MGRDSKRRDKEISQDIAATKETSEEPKRELQGL